MGEKGHSMRSRVRTRGKDGAVRAEAVERAVLHAKREHADAAAVGVHDQVQRKVFHEELRMTIFNDNS